VLSTIRCVVEQLGELGGHRASLLVSTHFVSMAVTRRLSCTSID
jgi:hypothetical protein